MEIPVGYGYFFYFDRTHELLLTGLLASACACRRRRRRRRRGLFVGVRTLERGLIRLVSCGARVCV